MSSEKTISSSGPASFQEGCRYRRTRNDTSIQKSYQSLLLNTNHEPKSLLKNTHTRPHEGFGILRQAQRLATNGVSVGATLHSTDALQHSRVGI